MTNEMLVWAMVGLVVAHAVTVIAMVAWFSSYLKKQP